MIFEEKTMCWPKTPKGEEDESKNIKDLQSRQNLIVNGDDVCQTRQKLLKSPGCRYALQACGVAFWLLVGVLCYYYRPFDLCFDKNGKEGKCVEIRRCPFIYKDIKQGKNLAICELTKNHLKVCCVGEAPSEDVPEIGPRHFETNTDNEDANRIVFLEQTRPTPKRHECGRIPNRKTNGRISFMKCLEYQERLVYPCEESQTPSGGMERVNNCNDRYPDSLIIGGDKAFFGEFPHMAMLGYESKTQEWQCAGVIVNERYVLTAAHCTYSSHGGNVTKVRIGFLSMSEPTDANTLYKVAEIIQFPNYNSKSHYNDIALLKTDRPMQLNRFAVPACLHDGSPIDDDKVIATGWGATDRTSKHLSDVLRKVTLEKFTDEECGRIYTKKAVRKLPHGYRSKTQICYGHRTERKDSSKGDSGGPVQIKHPHVKCMYLVTAIISTAKHFGVPGHPGIYTRIAPYLDWIEGTVWP